MMRRRLAGVQRLRMVRLLPGLRSFRHTRRLGRSRRVLRGCSLLLPAVEVRLRAVVVLGVLLL